MTLLLVPFPGNETLAASLAERTGGELTSLEMRAFPDGETYLQFSTPMERRAIALVCTLDRPDAKFLPLLFAAETARELGAASVGLVAPYLAYMRQDRRFRTGEAVTSVAFARAVSKFADWLVTVDPHLHRYGALSEIYGTPSISVHAAPLVSAWVKREIVRPLLIGPDEESAQWVAAIARDADAPHIVLRKKRVSDRNVEIALPDMTPWAGRMPVLVDDIISTGRTMMEALRQLRKAGFDHCACAAIHAVFAEGAYDGLRAAGATNLVTTNTISHPSNALDVSGLISAALSQFGA